MKNRSTQLSILAVAMALGTAWAVRGKFGHEQGAAWAGAIGALSLILVARRQDWHGKAFRILMAAAFGWGISGVMSYGAVVGYGRSSDFGNAFYGLLMLFVLGVLYGFIGGGFTGLALADTKAFRVKWHALITQMVAMGLLAYGVLILQLEWLMTPPRSEMWASCLGAAIALAWYIRRHHQTSVMKVAVWSALGAGFGFAFGNFLQVVGNASGVHFNFWNVMEYSIGFFGGAGMAYGTFNSSWPAAEPPDNAKAEWIPLVFVTLLVPFVVWQQSFVTDRFDFILKDGGSESVVIVMKLIAIAAILLVATVTMARLYSLGEQKIPSDRAAFLKVYFILYTGLYIILSFLVTGLFVHPPEQYLYIVNMIVILALMSQVSGIFAPQAEKPRLWITVTAICISVIALLALIAINSHDEIPGSKRRFETLF
ncbi:MAG TPA: hypothetical protein VF490_08170 [Chryseosolibacter sp.]